MASQNKDMRTPNGLMIVRNDIDPGGFRIDLIRPKGDVNEGQTFATIQRGTSGGWYSRQPRADSPDVLYVINAVDEEYGRERQRIEVMLRQAQQQRDQLNENFAPDWQRVIDQFGGE